MQRHKSPTFDLKHGQQSGKTSYNHLQAVGVPLAPFWTIGCSFSVHNMQKAYQGEVNCWKLLLIMRQVAALITWMPSQVLPTQLHHTAMFKMQYAAVSTVGASNKQSQARSRSSLVHAAVGMTSAACDTTCTRCFGSAICSLYRCRVLVIKVGEQAKFAACCKVLCIDCVQS